jgi:hypothetical protein
MIAHVMNPNIRTLVVAGLWLLAGAGNLVAQTNSFAVTVDPPVHGRLQLSPPLPADGKYPAGTVVTGLETGCRNQSNIREIRRLLCCGDESLLYLGFVLRGFAHKVTVEYVVAGFSPRSVSPTVAFRPHSNVG